VRRAWRTVRGRAGQPPRARGSLYSGLPPTLASGSETSKTSKKIRRAGAGVTAAAAAEERRGAGQAAAAMAAAAGRQGSTREVDGSPVGSATGDTGGIAGSGAGRRQSGRFFCV